MAFIVVTDTIFGVIAQAMSTLPTLALFAKVTPAKIEGTVFAFLTGTTNLASNVLSPMIGVWINEKYFGVTAEDLSQYKNLCLISLITSFLGFIVVPLIPTKLEIQQYQEERETFKQGKNETAAINNQIIKLSKTPAAIDLKMADQASKDSSGAGDDEEEERPLLMVR
jgi:MFS family permease